MKRQLLLAREFLAEDFQSTWYQPDGSVSRRIAYDDHYTKAIWIDPGAMPTSETRRQADRMFDWKIKSDPMFKQYKEQVKRFFWQQTLHAAKRALYHHGCVVSPRKLHRKDCSRAMLQVIDCAVRAGLFTEERSPPGSPKMSRLLPTVRLAQFVSVDPWRFDPQQIQQFVFLRDRESKEELQFDKKHPVAVKYQRRLAKINSTNAKFKIFYQPLSPWEQCYESKRQLRPIHYALFTDTFDQHGRIYTGRYGHQALRKIERHTIEFETEPHVLEHGAELDYGSYHPRLVYHLAGIDYRHDPYSLWGDATTPPMRLMAKVLLNAALNAKSPEAAISDCNRAMSSWINDKDKNNKCRKTGNALADAINLFDAAQQTGLTFKAIHALAMKRHQRIADQFCSDAGMRLMRLDSEIALRIMYHFAKQDIPCLGVHDSFIVPVSAKTELRRVMRQFYKQKTGHFPVVG